MAEIVVTSVLQTPAGRMIFGRPELRPASGTHTPLAGSSGSYTPVSASSGSHTPVKPEDKARS